MSPLSELADDLWMMAQCPSLLESEQAELYEMADQCATNDALSVNRRPDMFTREVLHQADTLRSRYLPKCLAV